MSLSSGRATHEPERLLYSPKWDEIGGPGGLRKELGLFAFRLGEAPVVAQIAARSGSGVSHFSGADAAISPLA